MRYPDDQPKNDAAPDGLGGGNNSAGVVADHSATEDHVMCDVCRQFAYAIVGVRCADRQCHGLYVLPDDGGVLPRSTRLRRLEIDLGHLYADHRRCDR